MLAADAGSAIFRFSAFPFRFWLLPLCFCWCSIIVSFDLFSVSSDFRQHSTLYGCFRLVFLLLLFFTFFWALFLLHFKQNAQCKHLSFAGLRWFSIGRRGLWGFPRGFPLHFCPAFDFDLRCLIVGKRLRTLCF